MAEERKIIRAFKEGASSYDDKYQKIAPIRETLNLLTRMLFLDVSSDGHVLCVGAGTGSEVLYLADAFPGMRFTAVEPASAMLDRCRARATEAGIASRCTFHHGYVDTLPKDAKFAAATALLVSHFITRPDERRDFFRAIASHLEPNGLFVNATLAVSPDSQVASEQSRAWFAMQAFSGLEPKEVERMRSSIGSEVVVRPTREIESEIASAGFSAPVPFMQSLLIHAWVAKRV